MSGKTELVSGAEAGGATDEMLYILEKRLSELPEEWLIDFERRLNALAGQDNPSSAPCPWVED